MSDENAKNHPYQNRKRLHRRWRKVVGLLACLVVFVTGYALMRPAASMNYKCGMEEHTHSAVCYRQKTTASLILQCDEKSLNIHSHTADCYDAKGKLICGYADYVIHTHSEDCYDAQGKLVCQLPEVKAHIHTKSCYKQDSSGEEVLTCRKE